MARSTRGKLESKSKDTSPLPKRLAPMLAETARGPFDSAEHLFEIKWDGIRCIAFVERDQLSLRGRRFVELLERYPELQSLRTLPGGTILDGEIVVLSEGRSSFEKHQQRMHATESKRIDLLSKRIPAIYIVFDLLFFEGQSLLETPLRQRRERLDELLASFQDSRVVAADYIVEKGKPYFEAAKKAGLEGIMAKRLDSPYLPGKRTTLWQKIKVARVEVFDIIGFTQRKGEPFASALVVGLHDGCRWVYKGNVGTGFNEAQRGEFFRELRKLPVLKAPPKDGPKDAVWKATGLRCRVRFFELTSTGKLRGPVFDGFEV